MPAGAAQFLVIDNNFVAIEDDVSTKAINVKWSVDSSPEDFTSTGSGSSLRYNMAMPLSGAVAVDNTAIIIGRSKAVRMIPTGTARPAFRFQDEPSIHGGMCAAPTGVAAKDSSVYFVDATARLMVYRNGQVAPIYNTRADLYNDGGVIAYSESEDVVVFQHSVASKPIVLINPNSNDVIGTFDISVVLKGAYDFPILSAPNTIGLLLEGESGNSWFSTATDPTLFGNIGGTFDTGYVDLGVDAQVEFVEIETESGHTIAITNDDQVTVEVLSSTGASTTVDYGTTAPATARWDSGGTRIYPVGIGGRWIRIQQGNNTGPQFMVINSISVIGQVQKDSDRGVFR